MQPAAESDPNAPIPRISVDPLASFVDTTIDLMIGDEYFEVTHRQADEWLQIFLADKLHLDYVLPEMLSDADQQEVEDRLRFGELSPEQLRAAIFELITLAAGRKWYIAISLCSFIKHNWDKLGGKLILAGLLEPSKFTFAAWLDAAYSICLDNIDHKHVGSFVSELTKAPEGYEEEIDWEAENENFMAAMSML